MAKSSVVVYGPQGSGKTRNAQRLARHFGLHQVCEADDSASRVRPKATGMLILTNRSEFAEQLARDLKIATHHIDSLNSREARHV